MPDDTLDDRLTILERATLLHDTTLRRHSEILDRHDAQMALLRTLVERQATAQQALATLAGQHQDRMDARQRTLDAIKDMLDRGNGH